MYFRREQVCESGLERLFDLNLLYNPVPVVT